MWLLILAAIGFLVPNGIFVYWLFTEYHGLSPVLHDKVALAFALDAVLAVVYLALYFSRRPPGSVRWPWFVALSLLGGLGFSLPFYYWLNLRYPGPGS
ncbi:MAG: hypothetical protein ABI679_14810 [Gemmatimonadota bacterium]